MSSPRVQSISKIYSLITSETRGTEIVSSRKESKMENTSETQNEETSLETAIASVKAVATATSKATPPKASTIDDEEAKIPDVNKNPKPDAEVPEAKPLNSKEADVPEVNKDPKPTAKPLPEETESEDSDESEDDDNAIVVEIPDEDEDAEPLIPLDVSDEEVSDEDEVEDAEVPEDEVKEEEEIGDVTGGDSNDVEISEVSEDEIGDEEVIDLTTEASCDTEDDLPEDEKLSEEFKAKAAKTLKEEVALRVSKVRQELVEKYEVKAAAYRETLAEKVDSYLKVVIAEWMKQNKVALASNLRTQVAEEFIDSLKSLFAEKYIEVPSSKKDLAEQLAKRNTQLAESLSADRAELQKLKTENARLVREKILSEASEALTVMEAEKLAKLAESVSFTSPEAFRKSVKTLRESHFAAPGQTSKLITESDSVINKKAAGSLVGSTAAILNR